MLTAACIVVHVVSAQPDLVWMWGAHFYAFFPPVVLYLATLALVLAVAFFGSGPARAASGVAHAFEYIIAGKRRVMVAIGAVVVVTIAFWTLRICHTYLGDGNVIVSEIDTTRHVLPREPLTSLLQYAVYAITKPWFASPGRDIRDVAQDAVAVGSVAAGIFFLGALWLLADELARLRPVTEPGEKQRAVTVLVWMCLAAQGYMQLFFGYVENYSFYAVGVIVFLWLCLRCLRGACSLLWPALSLGLGLALHLSAALLALPFVVVAVVVVAVPRRRLGALRDLAIIAALAAATLWTLARRGFHPASTILAMIHTAFADRRNHDYMFSGRHYRDFFNEQIIVGPLGIFLFACALVTLVRASAWRSGRVVFLVVAGATFALASWMVGDSNLGYARDWDLLSHAGMVFTAAGLGLFLVRRTQSTILVACLVVAWLMSVYSTLPWIATNASEARSLARLQTLPLGYGRTEVLVAGWYERHGDPDRERAWLERSVMAYSRNPNSYYQLGVMELGRQDYASAAAYFENAARCRPDHLPYQLMTVRAWFLSNDPGRAVPHLEFLRDRYPGNMTVTLYLGEALYQSGRVPEASREFESARRTCGAMVKQQPADALTWATYGWVLFRVGDVDSSLNALTHAVAIDPSSAEAQCYLGCVLRSVGRSADARAHFMKSRETRPDLPVEIPDRSAIMAWLASAE